MGVSFQIQDADYDLAAIEPSIVGAGILPVAACDDEYVLLLGKERFVNNWRGSMKWSAFEGGRKPGESVERTAAREYIEESLGVVPIGEACTVADVEALLLREQYLCKLVIHISNDADPGERRYHVTYMVHVRHEPLCVSKFAAVRRELSDVDGRVARMTECRDELARRELPMEGKMHGDSWIEEIDDTEVVDVDRIRLICYDRHNNKRVLEQSDPTTVGLYMDWFRAREQVASSLKFLTPQAHGAVQSVLHPRGALKHAAVNEDYLEKQHVQWWKLSDLWQAVGNGGALRGEAFRVYFLPVLKRCMQEIETFPRPPVRRGDVS